MKAVAQRVRSARVRVQEETVASIGAGLLVLVGVAEDDGPQEARALADKLVGLRIFPDEEGKMNRSVQDLEGGVLVVSQFTLLADLGRGRRPSFLRAAGPDQAEPLVEEVARQVEAAGVPALMGRFGAEMQVELVNDGPVTLIIELAGGKVR